MALIGNRSVLLKSPGRFLSGTVASIERNNYSTGGQIANRFQAMNRITGGAPTGHLSPSSWSLPRTAGAMSSINSAVLDIESSGLAYGGITTAAITSFSITFANATGELISSGEGTASFSITVADALLTASLGAVGSTSFSITTNSPILGAEASMVGGVTFTINGALIPFAIGNMIGTTDVTTDLTAGQVADAVWSAVAASNDTAGSMGEKLNDAGSASNPWTEIIESGYTAAEILRLLAAYAAGSATGLNGNAVFTGIDGTTTRIEGTVNGVTRTITGLDGL